MGYLEITNNILYDTGSFVETGDSYGAVMLWETLDVQFENNTIVDARVRSIWGKKTILNLFFRKNVIIGSTSPSSEAPSQTSFNYNYYYNTASSGYASGANDVVFATNTQTKISDYTFTYERFTKVPKQKILKGIITTKESPHYKKAGSNIMVK